MAQNVQIRTNDVNGKLVPNEKVADIYCWAAEIGDRYGVTPCLETHTNQWSEHFGRVVPVGEMVEKRGIKFNMTLDHSHVMFKIDNPREQEIQNMRADIEAGKLELNPFKPNDVCTQWINRNWVAHCHARAPCRTIRSMSGRNTPMAVSAAACSIRSASRGPANGTRNGKKENLEPWKEVLRRLLAFHATKKNSCLGQISTEFLTSTDYGGGAKYSIWRDSIAAVTWLRQAWEKAQADAQKQTA